MNLSHRSASLRLTSFLYLSRLSFFFCVVLLMLFIVIHCMWVVRCLSSSPCLCLNLYMPFSCSHFVFLCFSLSVTFRSVCLSLSLLRFHFYFIFLSRMVMGDVLRGPSGIKIKQAKEKKKKKTTKKSR